MSEHDDHAVQAHDHSWQPKGYDKKRCSGRWWCRDCKAWFTGDRCA